MGVSGCGNGSSPVRDYRHNHPGFERFRHDALALELERRSSRSGRRELPAHASDLDALRVETRVSAVLSVQHDECLAHQGIDYPGLVRHGRRLGLTMESCPLRDFDPADQQRGLPAAVRALWDLLRQGHRVYVHCTAGINRSPLVVLAYLTLVEGIGLEETITLLLRARPEVCPTWEAYHGCRQELTARHADRIRQRAFECSQRQPELSALDRWLQAERAIWREVLTAG